MPNLESPANGASWTKTKPARARHESAAKDYDPNKERHALRQFVAWCSVTDATHRAACDELINDTGRAEFKERTRDS
jgi:hypothetical protein